MRITEVDTTKVDSIKEETTTMALKKKIEDIKKVASSTKKVLGIIMGEVRILINRDQWFLQIETLKTFLQVEKSMLSQISFK